MDSFDYIMRTKGLL